MPARIKEDIMDGKLRLRRRLPAIMVLALLVAGCAGLFSGLTYYDPATYKHLTDLKPEVLRLYDTFAGDSLDMARLEAIRLRLDQIYEYEHGKGEKNVEAAQQVKIIHDMFDRHVADRTGGGAWNPAHTVNRKEIMGQAFDVAIRTEWLKNKNE